MNENDPERSLRNALTALTVLLFSLLLLAAVWSSTVTRNEAQQIERSAAFVEACRARPHVWARLDGHLWDLNACG